MPFLGLNDPLLLSCAKAVGSVEEYRGQEYSSLDADTASGLIIAKVWERLQSQNTSNPPDKAASIEDTIVEMFSKRGKIWNYH